MVSTDQSDALNSEPAVTPEISSGVDNTTTTPQQQTSRQKNGLATPNSKPKGRAINFLSSITSVSSKSNENITDITGEKSSSTQKKQKKSNLKKKSTWRHHADSKVVGLKNYGLDESEYEKRHQFQKSTHSRRSAVSSKLGGDNKSKSHPGNFSIEEKEEEVRARETRNPCALFCLGNIAAIKVMLYYLITLETIVSCTFTAGLTLYWYFAYPEGSDWNGGGLDFVLLAFALTAPMSAALTMAFNRRERALISIAEFRSWSYHLYMAHAFWDWPDAKGGREGADIDWLEHCDAVMAQLIGIGDELARFLSLPTTSRSRHRMTKEGRKEAARTIEVAYHILESLSTQRLTRLLLYSERLKKIGLPSGEVSRIRQFERFLSSHIEQLRIIKMYRTPQAFRSFARIFTLVLPPFYAPTYAQVAKEVNSLGVGVTFGLITCLGLTAFFESLQILEDPFTAFLALDGIDVREEFEVLHYAQLMSTRKLAFPEAAPYPPGRRAALTSNSKKPATAIGLPPMQSHHQIKEDTDENTPEDSVVGLDFLKPEAGGKDDFTLYDEGEEDVELGMPIDEIYATFNRETGYLSDPDDEEEITRGRLNSGAGSTANLRSRRHHRQWSHG